jgi:ATP-dependent Lhr-like helicase
VLAEGVPGGFAALYPELCRLETLGAARRGYFVEGLGGAQFALPGAVERLRAQREAGPPGGPRAVVLAATDPAQPYGAALPWGAAPGSRRQPGASVVLLGGEPVLYLERGGRTLRVLVATGTHVEGAGHPAAAAHGDAGDVDSRVEQALCALAEHARAGRLPTRIALERVDGEPVLGSRWETVLGRAGFTVGPRRAELAAR